MIIYTTKLISNCKIILEDELLLLTGDLKTDNKTLILNITDDCTNLISKSNMINIMQSNTIDVIKCKKIIKISDNCFQFKPSDIECINIKLFEYMHQWNAKYTYLIDHVSVFQE